MELFFEPEHFVENLSYMGKGLIGIFTIVLVIVAATLILNIATMKRK